MSRNRRFMALGSGLACLLLQARFTPCHAQHALGSGGEKPAAFIAPASNEGELAIKNFILPKDMKAELIAAEPHLANPVAFHIDEKGRIFVVETFRLHSGVDDIRGIMNWLDEDLAARTVEDRLAEMKRHVGEKIGTYSDFTERVKVLIDTDRDGKTDESFVYAENFNDPLDGIAAGVLARKGKVWLANIPNLWLLEDRDGDNKADFRKSLSYGYGVRVGFLGHDLHGLRFGPDGRLYFSIGDRGASVKQANGSRVGEPDCGAVFRCNPDGSELEVYAVGLRNPQELTFDAFGNLFTGDNNSDGGDQARWVYVVEGGDSGWRVGYQFIDQPNSRGPWNSEKMWHPQWDGQAAFIVPPITNVTAGPSGLTYYPGTGLPDRYNGHFFLVDFTGSKSSSIHSFALKQNGATFELIDHGILVSGTQPTDVDFGNGPGIYFSDWVQGWEKTGKGRIYRLFNAEADQKPSAKDVAKILSAGFGAYSVGDLGKLLEHVDMRVRQEAQFELADRGSKGLATLQKAASKSSVLFARFHGVWGLGQLARAHVGGATAALMPLLADANGEIRAQAAKTLGDLNAGEAAPAFIGLLKDSEPRVRFFAANALGRLRQAEAFPALVELLRANNDTDRYLRHAAVMGLAGIGDIPRLVEAAKDSSPAVRMGVLLAMRRLERAEISSFLGDTEQKIVIEAARAINDVPISGAMEELAALAGKLDKVPGGKTPELGRRVLNANYRVGLKRTAAALAALGASDAPVAVRAEAIECLGLWEHPSGRDRVTSLWRPVAGVRPMADAASALAPQVSALLSDAPDTVRLAVARASARLNLKESAPALVEVVKSGKGGGNVRAEALRSLAALNAPEAAEAVQFAQDDKSEEVRKEAVKLASQFKPAGAAGKLAEVVEKGSIGEKQSAIATLATVEDPSAEAILLQQLDKLISGKLEKELHLDVLEAAGKRGSASLKAKLKAYEDALPKNDPLAVFRPAQFGGNAAEGGKIFRENAAASCIRCHKVKGDGGEVGPELTGLIDRHPRDYILEAIIFPNKTIAQGFESVMVTKKDGTVLAGVLKSENDKELVVNSPEDGILKVPKSEIDKRERGLSAMPEGMTNILSRMELRNVVEFLSGAK